LTRDRIEHVRNWIPRVPREDPWRNRYPGTKLRGKKVYERKALPYAQYPGASDIAALVENYRIGIVRGQIKMVDKALADDFKDDHGRDKKAYLEYLSGLFERARWIDYRIEDLEVDTAKTGGTARYHYRFRVRDRDSGNVFDEKGVAYLEFSKPLEFLWKIRAIRMVKE
ncbi:MAG: nuclear transport factor 2 family protein, partial [Candidatus Hydrogenedentota bacterium]